MARPRDLVTVTPKGFYCPAGKFYIDPWHPVDQAVVTHAHGDHLVAGCKRYAVAAEGVPVFRARLGPDAPLAPHPYGQTFTIEGVRVSLHPAGHILGSAQVRIEHQGEVWVLSGDYKTQTGDTTCTAFEPVRCHTFVSEATFALPIYRWRPQAEVLAAINTWWQANREAGRASIVYAYALGKAQRVLAGLDPTIGPILTHGAVERLTAAYRSSGVSLPATTHTGAYQAGARKIDWRGALILAPVSARGSAWVRKFGDYADAFVSGWMQIRGARRRRAVDRGFVLSDHADWEGLNAAIAATGAEQIGVTHGYIAPLVRWLTDHGLQARGYATRFSVDAEEQETEGEALP
jgi:putative mRNA 3-end processing factor